MKPQTMEPQEARSWMAEAGTLAGRWVLSLLATLLGMTLLGTILAGLGAIIVGDHWRLQLLVAGVAVVGSLLAGVPLGLHRATSRTLIEASRRYRVASRAVAFAFDRLMQRDGERLEQALAGLSLAQTERTLHESLHRIFGEHLHSAGLKGLIVRRLHARVVREVERLTLAELRQQHGDRIDLPLIREHLMAKADQQVEQHLRAVSRRFTTLFVAAVAILLLLFATALRQGWWPVL